MNLDLILKLESLSKKLRKAFGLVIDKDNFSDFKQISFEELSACIQEAFPQIKIQDTIVDDTYMIKCYDDAGIDGSQNDFFEIYLKKQNIELLMHEVAHILFHNQDVPYNVPIGMNLGTWEQEIEANYFSRAFLIPEEYFIKALSLFSRNDGTVDLDNFANRFNVQNRMIVERGRDLKIW